jgi:hypothetical protein
LAAIVAGGARGCGHCFGGVDGVDRIEWACAECGLLGWEVFIGVVEVGEFFGEVLACLRLERRGGGGRLDRLEIDVG